jgi:sugar phosphate isomerase/epimerase
MVDLFHLWDVADVEAKIAAYGDRIFAVQISDWREPQRAWSDRVLPGDGIAPLASLVRALEASGYVGDYELEIMSDDGRYEIRLEDSLWLEDPAAVATRGYARLEALLAEGGVGAVANQR